MSDISPARKAQLTDLQQMVTTRMHADSVGELSWKERAAQLRGRLAAVQMWTVDETRPTFNSALLLAADAMTLLALVDEAETADHASRDQAA